MKLAVDGPHFGRGFRKPDGLVSVLLDGRPIKHVVAVDTATGVAWRYREDERGDIVVDRARAEAVLERISGSFRVQPVAQAPKQ